MNTDEFKPTVNDSVLTSLEQLQPAPYNPRIISEDAIKGLSKSIDCFGDIAGITWNKRTGHLVTGHQRVNQLRKAGGILRDGCIVLPNGQSFSVRIVDWDDGQEKAANVAANNYKIGGEFTPDLSDIIVDIEQSLDIESFNDLQFKELVDGLDLNAELNPESEVVQDEVPEPPKNPVTKLGDLWTLGDHTIFCGDCSDAQLSEPFELLVTDPPYGVSYASKNEFLNAYDKGDRNQNPIENDSHSPDEMQKLWTEWFSSIRKSAKPGASYYITGPQVGDLLLLFLLSLREAEFPLRHMLIWVKNNHVLGRCDFNYKHEPILFGWVDGAAHRFHGGKELFSVWEIDKPYQSKLHPTMKPVALFAKAISHSSQKGDFIYDPFLGSGTTLIAAEQLGRRCYGAEIEPKYVDVCVERWETLTGGKAKRNVR